VLPDDFAQLPFFRDADAQAKRDVARSAIWFSVPGGWPLFAEGDPADSLYFVRTGSVGAFRRGPDGRQEFLGHIRQGEPVGEMALIAGESHSASVWALRDTELFALDRAAFNRLVRRHPDLMRGLARTILFRSRQNRRRNPRADPKVYALLGASATIDTTARAHALRAELEAQGRRALVVGPEGETRGAQWFDDVERWNDIVLLDGGSTDTNWQRMCRRQADRLWLLAREGTTPQPGASHAETGSARDLRLVDLVMVRAAPGPARTMTSATGQAGSEATNAWMHATGAARLFAWRDGVREDAASLARVLGGQSVGLVLGGGGARAYAHIGAVRALREAGIRFDFLGGTSMGAVIAACVAMGWDDAEIERRIWDGFVHSNPLADYILPVVSLTSGRRVDERLERHFGDMRIEALERNFFCVSTNLTVGASRIHRTGVLRHALRASIALPGILPPVVDGDDVLVDGAVLENFPVSAMQDLHRGLTIGVDVTRQHALDPGEFRKPDGFFGWVLRHGFRSPPPIAELLMRAATAPVDNTRGYNRADLLIVPELEGVELRDWKAFDQAVEAGYAATVRALQQAGPLAAVRPFSREPVELHTAEPVAAPVLPARLSPA
jgi:NTE family protein